MRSSHDDEGGGSKGVLPSLGDALMAFTEEVELNDEDVECLESREDVLLAVVWLLWSVEGVLLTVETELDGIVSPLDERECDDFMDKV